MTLHQISVEHLLWRAECPACIHSEAAHARLSAGAELEMMLAVGDLLRMRTANNLSSGFSVVVSVELALIHVLAVCHDEAMAQFRELLHDTMTAEFRL